MSLQGSVIISDQRDVHTKDDEGTFLRDCMYGKIIQLYRYRLSTVPFSQEIGPEPFFRKRNRKDVPLSINKPAYIPLVVEPGEEDR